MRLLEQRTSKLGTPGGPGKVLPISIIARDYLESLKKRQGGADDEEASVKAIKMA